MVTKKQIKQVFNECDIDDDGYLNAEYLLKALIALKIPIEQDDILDLFESVGREKEKTVGLEDFEDIVLEFTMEDESSKNSYSDEENEDYNSSANKTFSMLADPTVDGITLESLLKVCKAEEKSWTKQQIIEMINEADLNHDGIIDSKEFLAICKKVGL